MASVIVPICGMCGTPVAMTSLVSCKSSTGGGIRLHKSRHNHVGSHNLHLRRSISTQAAKKGEQEIEETEQKEQKQETKTSFFTSVTDALDFAQIRSDEDAKLLADARQATRSGEKMNREQYAALRRKIGGTYKDFFKDSIDVIGDYVDDGWVDKTCRVCKKDTRNDPRTKDNLGRYAHVACLEKEKSGNFFTKLFGR